MTLRGHEPVVIDRFNGLYQREDDDYGCPLDHFPDCNNIRYVGSTDFATRYGIGNLQAVASVTPLTNIVRAYNYPIPTANTVIALKINGSDGEIYHIVNSTTVYGPVLTITGMVDFAFVPYNGRAYISPIAYYTQGDLNIEKGLQSSFLYVYKGDGTNARKAAGATPAGTLVAANGAAGYTDQGDHVFAVVGETDTGYLSAPCAFVKFSTSAALSVSFSSIPTFSGAQWSKRHIVATKKITNYNGNTTGYQFFFIPGATINDNTTTVLANQSFYDIDLLDDASHLLDNFAEIAAGAVLAMYHDRLCIAASYSDESVVYISAKGEPEAIDQINGLIIVPRDGNPITNIQELRDVMYTYKRSRTVAYTDNNEEPATWPITYVDNALGCPIHGIATVLDSGATTVDFLIVATFAGICLFNGKYIRPELTWKISRYWSALDRSNFRKIQMVVSPVQKELYIVTPDGDVLVGNYENGFDYKNIRWGPWTFDGVVSSITIMNISDIIIGMREA